MRCSDCGREIKPVVAFDIDGTLGDYHTHFVRFCVKYFGRPFPCGYDGTCDFEDYLGLTRTEYRAAKLAYRQGGLKRSLPEFPGARGLVRRIRLRSEVWIATTRPWQRLDNIDPDTVEWLRRTDIQFDGMLFGDDKYDQLVTIVEPTRIVAVVDDLPEQIQYAEKLGLNAYQIGRRHNESTLNYEQLEQALLANIASWHQEHNNQRG